MDALERAEKPAPANDGSTNAGQRTKVDFADLKCKPMLHAQLSDTLIHLLSLGGDAEAGELSDILIARAPVFERAVIRVAESIRQGSQS